MKFILLFERQLVVTALLLLLMWLCSVDSQKSMVGTVGTCNSAEIDSRARDPCVPCPSQKWFGMSKVTNQRLFITFFSIMNEFMHTSRL